MGKYGRTLLKALKYALLGLGAAALAGIGDALPGFLQDVLLKSGVPEAIAAFVGSYVTPYLAAVVAIAIQQLLKHRDDIFKPGQ